MTERDIADMWAYLNSVAPVRNPVPPHELKFPFTFRTLVNLWKLVNFEQGETKADAERSPQWNRGAYLVNHLGHCGACHTPNVLGNFLGFEFLGGSWQIPGAIPAPNITPDVATGIGAWSVQDVARALKRSMRPDGAPIRGPMAEYVVSGSSHMTEEDLEAMAVYLLSLPAEKHLVEPNLKTGQPGDSQGRTSAGVRSLMTLEGSLTRAK